MTVIKLPNPNYANISALVFLRITAAQTLNRK
jgi:hypothetical protein